MNPPDTDPDTHADTDFAPAEGGCACGALRYRIEREPLFVHACHCTRCQRETGGPFAHHAMVEWTAMTLRAGAPEFVAVPTDSGTRHWVARCPQCRTCVWNEWGSRRAVTRYVRVGTLDEPARFPPRAHIFARSRQPWLVLDERPGAAPVFDTWYDPAALWPAASRARHAAAGAAAKAAAKTRAKAPAKSKARTARAAPPARKRRQPPGTT
jgi:hypothetical protein